MTVLWVQFCDIEALNSLQPQMETLFKDCLFQ